MACGATVDCDDNDGLLVGLLTAAVVVLAETGDGTRLFDGTSAPAVLFAAAADDDNGGVVVVLLVGVGGIPHTLDSVSFTKLSPGLHIAAFCCGVNYGDVRLSWA
jgi:hypothetical protein